MSATSRSTVPAASPNTKTLTFTRRTTQADETNKKKDLVDAHQLAYKAMS
jgi:hypothetical protein